MDPITKAIYRIRQDRPNTSINQRALVPAEISYTQTRTVSLYPGWLRQNRIITGDSFDEYAKAYKILRTQVSQRMRSRGWRTLAVTSAGPGEGKTLTAINLCISLALETHHTVLLVDADLRQPSVHEYLGIDVEYGLREHLEDEVPLEEILVHPEISRFVVLPGTRSGANSSELLAAPQMLRLVQELKRRYPSRLVVFDLPPVLGGDDVLAIAPYLDAALLVVEEGRTQREAAARAAELLQAANQNLIGTVLNKAGP